MSIQVDGYYNMGQSQTVNQDYVLFGSDPIPYVIVADGCSSSPHTDLGARLLSWAGRGCLRDGNNLGDGESIKQCVQDSAMRAASALGLADQVMIHGMLDSTLILAYLRDDELRVHAWGDGVIALKARQPQTRCAHDDCGLHVVSIEYTHNAPYYISYALSDERERRWHEQSRDAYKTLSHRFKTVRTRADRSLELILPLEAVSMLLIATDGLQSFENSNTGQRVELVEIVNDITHFRNVNGSFLQRRLRRQQKEWVGKHIVHQDDVGVACMLMGE